MAPQLAELFLRTDEDRRVRRGHPWVYANEIDPQRSPLPQFSAGATAKLMDTRGSFVAWVDVNPNALICARVNSRDALRPLDSDGLRERLQRALQWREATFAAPFYRWVYGDSDALPGLVIDRFDQVLSVQIGTAAMEQRLPTIIELLTDMIKARAIILKNDSQARKLEGLEQYVRVASGEFIDPVRIAIGPLTFDAPLLDGQKTGWYFDHGANRRYFATLPLHGMRVLDLYSYVGAWTLQAAAAGAAQVTAVDSSATALQWLNHNARLQGVDSRIITLQADALTALAQFQTQNQTFDAVVLDPPALLRRKQDLPKAKEMYRKLNAEALRCVADNGLFISASCSGPLSSDDHLAAIRTAARSARRDLQLIHRGSQAEDHPVHPMLDASEYLKCLFFRVA